MEPFRNMYHLFLVYFFQLKGSNLYISINKTGLSRLVYIVPKFSLVKFCIQNTNTSIINALIHLTDEAYTEISVMILLYCNKKLWRNIRTILE